MHTGSGRPTPPTSIQRINEQAKTITALQSMLDDLMYAVEQVLIEKVPTMRFAKLEEIYAEIAKKLDPWA